MQADSSRLQVAEKIALRPPSAYLDQPPSIKAQVRILRQEWRLIAVVTILCTVGALVAAVVLPKEYRATVVLSPVTNRSGTGGFGALSSLTSALGGLSELAGVTNPEEKESAEDLAVLESTALTMKYIVDNNLLPILYRKKWDQRTRSWKVRDPDKIPTLWKANRYFAKKIRNVTTAEKTGIVTLEITWTDPVLAAKWANGLVQMTNDYLRGQAIDEANRDIAFLEGEAGKTNLVQEQQAIYTVMTMEINKAMLARGSEQYAFRVLDPAVPPELPSSPMKLLWTVAGFGGGLLLGVFIAFARAAWRESP